MDWQELYEGSFRTLGGLGLFLLGMSVMTEGLRALAGDRLRQLLARSAGRPWRGVVTGALTTATLQSSSVTTVAVIGFVGAGLLTFPQALGIVLGANVGTTVTGWLVVLLGFKLKLGLIALPLVLIGVLMRLLGSDHRSAAGSAIAGFGLLFVGIGGMQEGLGVFSDTVTPEFFPPATASGRIGLALIGVAITLVTQSSSAGIAMAVTAVSVGSLSLSQAAAMVIGMDVGTTIKAVLATIGSTVQAKRTGLAHLIYNLFSAAAALVVLTPYLWLIGTLAPDLAEFHPEVAVVAFHTACKLLGVATVLPLADPFARLIERLVPERGVSLTRRLDPKLCETPEVAVTAVMATVEELVAETMGLLADSLRERRVPPPASLQEILQATRETERYLGNVHVSPDEGPLFAREQAAIHVLDHLRRLLLRMRDNDRMRRINDSEPLRPARERLAGIAIRTSDAIHECDDELKAATRAEYQAIKRQTKKTRTGNIEAAVAGRFDVLTAMDRTDAARGVHRMAYHIWRIIRQWHVAKSADPTGGNRRGNDSSAPPRT